MQMHRSLPHKILLYAKQRRGLAPADWMLSLPAWCNWSVCLNMNTLVFGSAGGSRLLSPALGPRARALELAHADISRLRDLRSQHCPLCGRELEGGLVKAAGLGVAPPTTTLSWARNFQLVRGSKFLQLYAVLSCHLQSSVAYRPAPARPPLPPLPGLRLGSGTRSPAVAAP